MRHLEESNKIIAEFMGYNREQATRPYWVDPIEYKPYYDDEFQFHTSWDWLMPVIDKIKYVTQEPEELDTLKDTLWWGTIEVVYTEVVETIEKINSGEIETAE